jgi:ribosome-binding protein aMBF1 (putative translation factor)
VPRASFLRAGGASWPFQCLNLKNLLITQRVSMSNSSPDTRAARRCLAVSRGPATAVHVEREARACPISAAGSLSGLAAGECMRIEMFLLVPQRLVSCVERNVRRLRIAAGLSQAELAERMGVDRAYVSGLELRQRNPTVITLWHVGKALGVKLRLLFEETTPRRRGG